MAISAALIVRDEESHLPGCLGALDGWVDEVVVVDTGSSDGSVELARSLGAVVLQEPWCDDFAHVRNRALAAATGDWILYLDADERVAVRGELGPILDEPTVVAARVAFRAASGLTPYLEYRLFRNRPDLRFRGLVHETVVPDILSIVDREGARVTEAPLYVEHLGYEGDLSAKHRRNRPLLRRAVALDPRRVYLWHTLGEAELGLGATAAAERAWRKGLEVVRGRSPEPGDVLLYADLFGLHFSEERPQADVIDLTREVVARHPEDPLALWCKARLDLNRGRFEQARATVGRMLELAADDDVPRELGYDRRLFGEFAWGLLGTSWLAEGRPQQALAWLRRAEKANPENEELRIKRRLAEGRAREA